MHDWGQHPCPVAPGTQKPGSREPPKYREAAVRFAKPGLVQEVREGMAGDWRKHASLSLCSVMMRRAIGPFVLSLTEQLLAGTTAVGFRQCAKLDAHTRYLFFPQVTLPF